jgi:inner membrane protein
MNSKGHIGFTLTILTPTLAFLSSREFKPTVFLVLAVILSTLPDIDLKIRLPHRRYTHNIFFITLTSLFFGYLTSLILEDFNLGFYSALISGSLHLVGDLMTYMAFSPLYPLSDVNISLRLFKSNNALVNNILLITGVLMLVIYLIT